jgi:fatty acid desaturase
MLTKTGKNQPHSYCTFGSPPMARSGHALHHVQATLLEDDMPDQTGTTSEQARLWINLNRDHQLRYWTEKLGVNARQLRAAIDEVGSSAERVREYLATGRGR